jgi:hypothetical protein
MHARRSLAWLPLVASPLFALLAGCGGAEKLQDEPGTLTTDTGTGGADFETGTDWDTGTDPGPTLDSLAIEPANETIFIDTTTGKPASLTYKVTLGTTDVSDKTAFTLADPALGTFTGATFTSAATLPGSALGVTTVVSAVAEGKTGQAKLTIVKLRKTPDPTGKKDFFFTVPYKKDPDPKRDVLKFSTNINKVDVAFAMDTTGSMGGSITNLKSSLTTTIIPSLAAKIPSVGLAVVDHKDFTDGAAVLRVRQRITTDTKLANAAVSAMSASGGGDTPEAQVAAMQHMLTGAANGVIKAHTPAPGTFGGVEFRPGAVPVIVLITDANWNNPSGSATIATMTAEFKKNNVKFVGINTGSKLGVGQANTLSDATTSNLPPSAFAGKCAAGQCCTGYKGAGKAPDGPGGTCRLNFDAGAGDGVSDSVVTAITAISVGSTYDITAVPANDPTNAPGPDGKPVDALGFIKALRAMSEGDAANGCGPNTAYDSDKDGIEDTFKAVVVGTPVCFEVIPKMNETVPPLEVAQFFNAFIDVIGMPGSVNLGDRRTVVFLVPPKDPGIK